MALRLVPPPMKPPESTSTYGRRAARRLPVDLLAIVAFVLLADAVVSLAGALPFLRVVVGFPILFFVPGYVLLAALFPGEAPAGTPSVRDQVAADGGIALSTRLALSFGLSVALLPVFAVGLAFSPAGFGTESLLGLLTAFVVLGAAIGAVRRLRLPPEARFQVPARRRLSDFVGFVAGPGSPLRVGLNLLLVASILVAASGFAYAVFVPPADPEYADFMLLTESGDGEYVSSGYPTEFTRGEAQEVVVGIANHREERTRYSVVVELQRVRGAGSDLQVLERSELTRFGAPVEPEETWYGPHDVAPDVVGEDLRLVYYLYLGDAPDDPTTGSAEEHLHLWIDVSVPT